MEGSEFWAFLVWKHFARFGVESGMVFGGNYGSVHEWTYLSFQFQMNKNEIEMYEFEMPLENFLFPL